MTEALRGMNVHELVRLGETDAAAAEQLRLRRQLEATCRGVLVGLGLRYTGTGGWHVGAYVDPDGRLGFVNIAKGVAVATDVVLDSAVIEAGTVPDQPAGPQVSGAVVWAAPDPGEAHHASAPAGWTQLVVELRAHTATALPVACRAHVVAWGLRTCYDGKVGYPGYRTLDGQFCYPDERREGEYALECWPVTDTTTEMRRVASDALDEIVRGLASYVPSVAAAMPDPGKMVGVLYAEAARTSSYTTGGAARFAMHSHPLAGSHIERLHSLAVDDPRRVMDRRMEFLSRLVERVLWDRLTEVAEVLAGFLGPLMDEDQCPTTDYGALWAQLRALAGPMQARFLRDAETAASRAAYRAVAAYTAGGPIDVRIEVEAVA